MAVATPPRTRSAIIIEFLELFAAKEIDAACDLLAEDTLYTNVSLPSVRGRERVRSMAHRTLGRPPAGFDVVFHSIAEDEDGVVLTERTDAMVYGRFRAQFWVYGRFEVRDGQITVWRDSFDWWNLTLANLRGLAGIAIPSLRATLPPR